MDKSPKNNGNDKRDLVIKTRLSADEFLGLRDKCAATGIAISAHIRSLIKRDANPEQPVHRTGERRRGERPRTGPVRAYLPPSRGRFGAPVPRLRL